MLYTKELYLKSGEVWEGMRGLIYDNKITRIYDAVNKLGGK